MSHNNVGIIGGSKGGMLGARHPLWDPILLFSHTFSPKGAHVGGPCPRQWVHAPPTGNPGSATGNAAWEDGCFSLIFHSPETNGSIEFTIFARKRHIITWLSFYNLNLYYPEEK